MALAANEKLCELKSHPVVQLKGKNMTQIRALPNQYIPTVIEKDFGFIGGGHGGLEKERGPAPVKIQKETGI